VLTAVRDITELVNAERSRQQRTLEALLLLDEPGDAVPSAVAQGVRGRDGCGRSSRRRYGAAESPDLVLMDLSLPVMNGWEATRFLKANEATRDIPVIALTAHAMQGDGQKVLEAGCDDYDTKPINFSRLLEKINKYLD
jgi:CheY-like chemotaxis protein